MRAILILWRREIGAAFLSPLAYVILVLFGLLTGITFITGVSRNLGTSETFASLFGGAALLWETALVTVLTQRLFAEERRAKTLEMLMAAPVTETHVVLGKFAGAYTVVLLALAWAMGAPLGLALWSAEAAPDAAGWVGTALILALTAAFWTSLGLLASLLTRHPVVGAMGAFGLIWFAALFGWFVSALPLGWQRLGEALSTFSHLETFTRGVIDTRPVVFYVSATATVLFVAVGLLESRRWL